MLVFKPWGLGGTTTLWVINVLILLSVVVPFGLLAQTAVRASKLEYRIHDTALEIIWGKPIRIDLSEIESVERVNPGAKLSRTVGTSLPGLHIGRFHLAGVGSIRLYAGRIEDHLVLVKTRDGQRWGVTPEAPDRFVAEIRARL